METDKHVFSFQVNRALAEKMNELVGFCRNNEVRCSEGLVMRALIEHTELGPDLLGIVRARKETERLERREAYETNDDGFTKRGRAKRKG
jgi:hypothetical protein